MLTEKLMTLRKEKGLSQSELAERLEVSRQAVSRWENGDAAPGIENLKALRDLYGVTIDYLLSDEEGTVPVPEPEPEPAKAQSAPAPVRPRRTVIAILVAVLAVAAMALILLFLHAQTQKNSPPADGYIGPSPVHSENGPIEGRMLRGYVEYELTLESIDSRANTAGKWSVPVLSAVDGFAADSPGYAVGKSAAGFTLEAGESVLIKGACSQFDLSVKVGLLDENGVFYGAEGSNGLFDCTFKAEESGTYYFAVVNNSSAPVNMGGYLYFWLFK